VLKIQNFVFEHTFTYGLSFLLGNEYEIQTTMGDKRTAAKKQEALTMIIMESPKDIWQQKEATAYVTDKKLHQQG
jgi:hypothetical protein